MDRILNIGDKIEYNGLTFIVYAYTIDRTWNYQYVYGVCEYMNACILFNRGFECKNVIPENIVNCNTDYKNYITKEEEKIPDLV